MGESSQEWVICWQRRPLRIWGGKFTEGEEHVIIVDFGAKMNSETQVMEPKRIRIYKCWNKRIW